MTGAGVDVLAAQSVEPFRADAVRHPGPPRRRSTHASVEARSRGAAGRESSLADGTTVASRTKALESTIAGVQAKTAVTTWSTLARVSSILTPLSGEFGITQTLTVSVRAKETSSCSAT